MCDFETTVYDNQDITEVWAAACVPLYTEDVKIFHSIEEQFSYFKSLKTNIIAYYHNLKFDGSFWIDYLLRVLKYKHAYYKLSEKEYDIEWRKNKDMFSNSFKYSISDKGQWYSITIKTGKQIIEIRDSLKLLPFSVKRIGDSFGTKHKKLEMEYKGFRFPGCEITDTEKEYIANDVLVVKEALEIMLNEGHEKTTIGSCCLSEYKKIVESSLTIQGEYDKLFPNLYELTIDPKHGASTAGDYIRKSYRGGWCYLVKGKEGRVFHNGVTADVNSLYPSMMHSESGNVFPIGKPCFWSGNYIPDKVLENNRYYFVRLRTRFYIRENKLPFIQIKNNLLYKGTESLETSDVYDYNTGKYFSEWVDASDNKHDTRVELTMTCTDYQLFKEHYELVDCEIIDGCWFYTMQGLFDEYINKYAQIKKTSKGALRELAKLFLNNLYGKFASSTDSSFKLAYIKDDESIGFIQVEQHTKEPGYIPIGSAITSYARNFTIRAAQKNYYGKDAPGFIYADTDSIHCDIDHNELKGVRVDSVNFCCWKLESCWDEALFTRQKTYIEHITHEDLKPVEQSYYNIKCAGMPSKCKDLFNFAMTHETDKDLSIEDSRYLYYLTPEQKDFLYPNGKYMPRVITDFKVGLTVPGKLMPKRIKGGILLVDTTYEMR